MITPILYSFTKSYCQPHLLYTISLFPLFVCVWYSVKMLFFLPCFLIIFHLTNHNSLINNFVNIIPDACYNFLPSASTHLPIIIDGRSSIVNQLQVGCSPHSSKGFKGHSGATGDLSPYDWCCPQSSGRGNHWTAEKDRWWDQEWSPQASHSR